MQGLMQDWPLLCQRIIDHAALCHGDQEVVTRSVEGPIHRYGYRAAAKRAKQLLAEAGYKGEKIVVMAPSDYPTINAASLTTAAVSADRTCAAISMPPVAFGSSFAAASASIARMSRFWCRICAAAFAGDDWPATTLYGWR